MAAGYSKRSLVDKLGLKVGFKAIILNPPANYGDTLGELPAGVTLAEGLQGPLDFIQFFTRSRQELALEFPSLKGALAPAGMLWVSWPKRAAGVETDLDEKVVREVGLENGLVDVKVCAVDETWSGLKFVYRTRDRG